MDGRIGDQIKTEDKIQADISSLNHYISDYYYSLGSSRKSHMTKLRYVQILTHFLSFYSNILGKDVSELTDEEICGVNTEMIDRYLNQSSWKGTGANRKPVSPSTISLKISVINSFYDFLYRREIISRNPCGDKIERPKQAEVKDVVYLTPEEINIVVNNIKSGYGSELAKTKQEKMKYRDLLLFLIPIYTGLRVTALKEINISDLFLEENYIMATDKGNKTKEHYINDDIKKILFLWLNERNKILGETPCDALFISNRKQRMSYGAIKKIVIKFTQGIDKKITPHKLRATCATTLLAATNDIYLVANVLGHSSTEPTKRYAALDKERLLSVPKILDVQINKSVKEES